MESVHFLGVCGTAMGSVAVAMKQRGYRVTGQDDKVYPPMSDYLEHNGVPITQGYAPEGIPEDVDFIVVGNAMSRGNPAVEAVLNRKLLHFSLPETLKQFFLRGRHNLVVTGTHGKTTTTSMLAWILEYAGKQPGWLIGGIPANLDTSANLRESDYFVIEGDEYDTAFFDKRSKFLHYLPELVVINNIEFDHADIYRDIDEIKLTFRRLVNIVPSAGFILANADDANVLDVTAKSFAPVCTVGFAPEAIHRITDARTTASGSEFDFLGTTFAIAMSGDFNIRNAAMAATAAQCCGVPVETIREALDKFRGIKRRQEIRGVTRGVTVIDDFGHHPTAIRETLRGLRMQYEINKDTESTEATEGTQRVEKGCCGNGCAASPRSGSTRVSRVSEGVSPSDAASETPVPPSATDATGKASMRLWAIFEPRSNTTRRNVFQQALPEAFAEAHGVFLSQVARLDQLAENERLDPERVIADLAAQGKVAHYEKDADAIVERLVPLLVEGDVVVVFSNGGFDGIHEKLLNGLKN